MIRREIFYTPGLISLLGLAAIIICYLDSRHVFDTFNVLTVNWDYFDPFKRDDHKKHFFKSLQSKTYIDIVLDSHVDNNATKLRFSRLIIQEILTKDDVSRGIHFHLTDEMPYETFVRIMEIYMIEKSIAFYGKDNDIWIFNYKPLPENDEVLRQPAIFCGTTYYNDEMYPDVVERNVLSKVEAKHILPFVLFLTLGFFSWKKIKITLSPNASPR